MQLKPDNLSLVTRAYDKKNVVFWFPHMHYDTWVPTFTHTQHTCVHTDNNNKFFLKGNLSWKSSSVAYLACVKPWIHLKLGLVALAHNPRTQRYRQEDKVRVILGHVASLSWAWVQENLTQNKTNKNKLTKPCKQTNKNPLIFLGKSI